MGQLGPPREVHSQPTVSYNRGESGQCSNPALLGTQGTWMGIPGAHGGWGESWSNRIGNVPAEWGRTKGSITMTTG